MGEGNLSSFTESSYGWGAPRNLLWGWTQCLLLCWSAQLPASSSAGCSARHCCWASSSVAARLQQLAGVLLCHGWAAVIASTFLRCGQATATPRQPPLPQPGPVQPGPSSYHIRPLPAQAIVLGFKPPYIFLLGAGVFYTPGESLKYAENLLASVRPSLAIHRLWPHVANSISISLMSLCTILQNFLTMAHSQCMWNNVLFLLAKYPRTNSPKIFANLSSV